MARHTTRKAVKKAKKAGKRRIRKSKKVTLIPRP